MILYFFMAVHLILMQVVNLVGGEHLVVWEEVSRYGNKILCNTILTQRVFVIEGYLEATSVVSASEQSLIPLLSPYTLAHCAGCRKVSECMRNRKGGGEGEGQLTHQAISLCQEQHLQSEPAVFQPSYETRRE